MTLSCDSNRRLAAKKQASYQLRHHCKPPARPHTPSSRRATTQPWFSLVCAEASGALVGGAVDFLLAFVQSGREKPSAFEPLVCLFDGVALPPSSALFFLVVLTSVLTPRRRLCPGPCATTLLACGGGLVVGRDHAATYPAAAVDCQTRSRRWFFYPACRRPCQSVLPVHIPPGPPLTVLPNPSNPPHTHTHRDLDSSASRTLDRPTQRDTGKIKRKSTASVWRVCGAVTFLRTQACSGPSHKCLPRPQQPWRRTRPSRASRALSPAP